MIFSGGSLVCNAGHRERSTIDRWTGIQREEREREREEGREGRGQAARLSLSLSLSLSLLSISGRTREAAIYNAHNFARRAHGRCEATAKFQFPIVGRGRQPLAIMAIVIRFRISFPAAPPPPVSRCNIVLLANRPCSTYSWNLGIYPIGDGKIKIPCYFGIRRILSSSFIFSGKFKSSSRV